MAKHREGRESMLEQIARKILRIMGARFGITLARDYSRDWQFHLYPESERPATPTYVNIGAGSFFHPLWHNVDMPNEFYKEHQSGNIHIVHDLCGNTPLPFGTDTLSIVYTSHVIEHLPQDSVCHLFSEVHRCLKPGGLFRVTCPDMSIQYRAYQMQDAWFWPQPSPWGTNSATLEDRFLEHFATILSANHAAKNAAFSGKGLSASEFRQLFESSSTMEDFFTRFTERIPSGSNTSFPEGHCNWFTEPKVVRLLEETGFQLVYASRFGQSADPRLRNTAIFDGTVPWLSLYVECRKEQPCCKES